MAQNYSYGELMQMQTEAIERVKEMQARSKNTTNIANEQLFENRQEQNHFDNQSRSPEPNLRTSSGAEFKKKPVGMPFLPISPKPKHISMPVEFPVKRVQNFLKPLVESEENSEKFLLIALLALLISEEADKTLIFAVVYILLG